MIILFFFFFFCVFCVFFVFFLFLEFWSVPLLVSFSPPSEAVDWSSHTLIYRQILYFLDSLNECSLLGLWHTYYCWGFFFCAFSQRAPLVPNFPLKRGWYNLTHGYIAYLVIAQTLERLQFSRIYLHH